MPLEATMMIIDNSEYMRNGDYPPTRFEAQTDAVNTVYQTKTDSNPENSVGIMTMAGKGPEVLVTHTRDQGQILSGLHTASKKLAGQADLTTAINVAQLALKHRQNKNLRQRIILFVGSPVEGDDVTEDNLVKIARKLKKNNVAVDVVCFGDGIEERETPLMKVLIDNANSGDNSHLVVIPPDPRRLLSDALITSLVLAGDRSASIPEAIMTDGPATGGAGTNEFDFDPNLDPELAMALRMSLEEDNARRAAERATTSTSASAAPNLEPIAETTSQPPIAPVTSIPAEPTDDDEAALLQQALSMSQAQSKDEDIEMDVDHSAPATTSSAQIDMDEDEDEEEAIRRAIAMSMDNGQGEKKQ